MNKQQKLDKLQKEAPDEIVSFIKAAKKVKTIDGLSISGDAATLDAIEDILKFNPSTVEGRELKAGILKQARAKSRKGIDGKGMFFIA